MKMIPISCKAVVTALALAGAGLAHAQGTDIVSANEQEIQLYKSASLSEAAAKIPAKDFPWKIQSKSKGFYQVTTPGGSGWVNAMDVRTAPAATVVCSTPPTSAHVAGSMNASTPRCK
jgi:hypothetical protein